MKVRYCANIDRRGILTGFAVVMVLVSMGVLLGANIIHLVDASALGAALNGAALADGEPDGGVGVGGVASASEVALFTEGLDGDGVVEGACE